MTVQYSDIRGNHWSSGAHLPAVCCIGLLVVELDDDPSALLAQGVPLIAVVVCRYEATRFEITIEV